MRGDSELRARGLIPVPPNFTKLIREAMFDPEKFAAETFNNIDELKPQRVPDRAGFPDQKALRAWQQNGTPIPDALLGAFASWLTLTQARTRAISENERRLRASTWAQNAFRKLGKHDFARQLADFHRDEWGIAHVCEDSAECEEQVQAVARNGQRRDVRRG